MGKLCSQPPGYSRPYIVLPSYMHVAIFLFPSYLRLVLHVSCVLSIQILLDYLHSHWQPWLKRDIQSILDEPAIAAVRGVPYISIHVRRGDKLIREAKAHDVKVLFGMRR